tara:strand:+ start:1603 stop:2241 length:639 start_codon:yes stop_codon:yes gene_type:complete
LNHKDIIDTENIEIDGLLMETLIRQKPLSMILLTGVILASIFSYMENPALRAWGLILGENESSRLDMLGNGGQVVVGGRAPAIQLPDSDGGRIELLTEAAGGSGPIWLTFMTTWCATCKAESVDVRAVITKQHVETTHYAISLGESADEVNRAMGGAPPFRVLVDSGRTVGAAYNIRAVPTHVFIDSQGFIQNIHVGSLSRTDMERRLEHID